MKLIIKKADLAKRLVPATSVASTRNTLPIINNVLLEAKGNELFLSATDLEVSVKFTIPAEVVKAGSITLSARKLNEIVREMPDGDITLTLKDNDRVDIESGKTLFKMFGLPASEFPAFAVLPEMMSSLPSSAFSEMIKSVKHAISSDETKYNLNGVFFQASEGVVRMVATDGLRLSATKTSTSSDVASELDKGVTIPRKGIMELEKFAETIKEGNLSYGFSNNVVTFFNGADLMQFRLIDGEFPAYRNIIPASTPIVVEVEKTGLMQTLKRISTICAAKGSIKLEFSPGKVALSASSPELGECNDELATEYAGETMEIRVNPHFLMDAVAVVKDKVHLHLTDSTKAMMVRSGNDFMALIMPMRS